MGRGPRGLVSPIFRQTEGRKPRNLSSLPHRNGWHYRACRGGQFSPPRIGIYTSSSADSKLARSSRATNAESVVQSSPKLPDHCRATLGWHPTIRANPERVPQRLQFIARVPFVDFPPQGPVHPTPVHNCGYRRRPGSSLIGRRCRVGQCRKIAVIASGTAGLVDATPLPPLAKGGEPARPEPWPTERGES